MRIVKRPRVTKGFSVGGGWDGRRLSDRLAEYQNTYITKWRRNQRDLSRAKKIFRGTLGVYSLKRSSNAFRGSSTRGVVVSRSTVVRGAYSGHVFLPFLGEIRTATGCMHSNRAPGSKNAHCEHACKSVPQRGQRLLNSTGASRAAPHGAQRTTSRNPGMLMLRGPSCEIRRAPAGAPGSLAGRAGFGFG